jgi:hypothetical protein
MAPFAKFDRLKTVIVHGNFRNGKKDGSAVSPVPDRYW